MRHAFTVINSSLICLLSSVPCLAQVTAPEEPEKSYVLSYFIVGLGITLGLVAIMTGQWLLLPIVGFVFVAEAMSVMIQVGYFKFSKKYYGEGRRIFRMTPLHQMLFKKW